MAVQRIDIAGLAAGSTPAQAAATKTSLGLPQVAVASVPYRSGRSYLAAPQGSATTSTNNTILANDSITGTISYINAATSVNSMGFRTSSTSASVGASIRLGIYNVDQATGLPTTLVAQSGVVAITDAAASATFSGAITATPLPIGAYLFCVLATATTTGVRGATFTAAGPWTMTEGAATATLVLASTPIIGYSGTSAFASGFPATFPTPTVINTVAAAVAVSFQVT